MAFREGEAEQPRRIAVPPRYDFPDFVPHPLFRSGHSQTIAGAYVPHRRLVYRAQVHSLELPDGDRTALHDDCPATWSDGDQCVLLLHGLGGSHLSPYMVRVSEKLRERGTRCFRLDLRGHGLGWDWAQQPGHAGRSEDARGAITRILEMCPRSNLAAIGISMGGNILLKLLGEWGEAAPPRLTRAMTVAPPVDLERCSRNLLKRDNRIYARAFLRSLQRQLRIRRGVMKSLATLRLERPPRTLWEFDDVVTAPLSGFAGVQDYYQQCSAARVTERIAIPTTILAAADDPLIPVTIYERATFSPSVRIHITGHGGHVGYLGVANRDPDRRWLDWRILEWLQAPLMTGDG
jgi:predicted alpha/beta-fold hydrolase